MVSKSGWKKRMKKADEKVPCGRTLSITNIKLKIEIKLKNIGFYGDFWRFEAKPTVHPDMDDL